MRDLSYIRSWFADNNPSGFYHKAVITTGDPRTVNDRAPRNPLGILYRHWDGNIYRYVKFDWGTDQVTALAGGCVHWKQLNYANGLFTVTSDISDSMDIYQGVGIPMDVAGFLGCVVTNGRYCWVQVGGAGMVLANSSDEPSGTGVLFDGGSNDLTVSAWTSSHGLVVAQSIQAIPVWTGDPSVIQNPIQARILIVPA